MSTRRRTILILLPAFSPAKKFGGPIRSIEQLCDSLGAEFDLRILTSDTDLGEPQPLEGITTGRWVDAGSHHVRYLTSRERTHVGIVRIVRETPHDVLYLNSFFHHRWSLALLAARRTGRAGPANRVLLAPRGELLPGALSLKPIRKNSLLIAGELGRLWHGVHFHATSAEELADVQRRWPAAGTFLAPDIPDKSLVGQPRVPPRSSDHALRLIFASRITPKKNLLYALELLGSCNLPITLSIAGPTEDIAYWSRCRSAIAELPANISVSYIGTLSKEELYQQFLLHDLFILPSLSENFGHVIAEALSHGLPCLISDQTFFRGLELHGAGWDLDLSDAPAWKHALSVAAAENDSARQLRRAAALRAAEALSNRDAAVRMTRRMFEELLHT